MVLNKIGKANLAKPGENTWIMFDHFSTCDNGLILKFQGMKGPDVTVAVVVLSKLTNLRREMSDIKQFSDGRDLRSFQETILGNYGFHVSKSLFQTKKFQIFT